MPLQQRVQLALRVGGRQVGDVEVGRVLLLLPRHLSLDVTTHQLLHRLLSRLGRVEVNEPVSCRQPDGGL